jgi:hypothetical protein
MTFHAIAFTLSTITLLVLAFWVAVMWRIDRDERRRK